MSSNVFPFARCDSQELAANNIIYIYVSKNPMPRDEITSIRFFFFLLRERRDSHSHVIDSPLVPKNTHVYTFVRYSFDELLP